MNLEGGGTMISTETLHYELEGRFRTAAIELDKHYLSVRWEPAPRIVRVGACIEPYDWDRRMAALTVLLDFERDHADEFAVDFDIVPLHSVNDEEFAEA